MVSTRVQESAYLIKEARKRICKDSDRFAERMKEIRDNKYEKNSSGLRERAYDLVGACVEASAFYSTMCSIRLRIYQDAWSNDVFILAGISKDVFKQELFDLMTYMRSQLYTLGETSRLVRELLDYETTMEMQSSPRDGTSFGKEE